MRSDRTLFFSSTPEGQFYVEVMYFRKISTFKCILLSFILFLLSNDDIYIYILVSFSDFYSLTAVVFYINDNVIL